MSAVVVALLTIMYCTQGPPPEANVRRSGLEKQRPTRRVTLVFRGALHPIADELDDDHAPASDARQVTTGRFDT